MRAARLAGFARLAQADNFATFYVPGSNHTLLVGDPTVKAGSESVSSWLAAFLDGRAGHAGP